MAGVARMRLELEKEFVKSKKFCPIRLAKSSDVDSRFNVSAASAIAHCEEKRKKYERGIIPSDQTCRRVMQCVYNAAVQNGFCLRRFRCTKMAMYGAGAMKMGVSRMG